MNTSGFKPLLLLIPPNFFWAGNVIVGRYVADQIPPFTLNFLRWFTVAVILFPLAGPSVIANNFALLKTNAWIILAFALTGITCYQSLTYAGLHFTTAVNASLINSTTPLAIILCGWLLAGERTNSRQLVGIAFSVFGLSWVISQGDIASLANIKFNFGDLLIMLALPMWGIYSVLLRQRPPELSNLTFLFLVALIGSITTLPAVAIENWNAPSLTFSISTVSAVLYLALGPSIAAYLCWNYAVKKVGSNIAGCSMSLVPIFVIALASSWLHEPLFPYHFVGLSLTVTGVFLSMANSGPKLTNSNASEQNNITRRR